MPHQLTICELYYYIIIYDLTICELYYSLEWDTGPFWDIFPMVISNVV